MSTDIRLSKAQISKIIQLSGFLCGMLGSLGNVGKVLVKKAITDFAVPFATDVLPGLVNNSASNATSNVIDKLGRKISGKGAVRAETAFTLFISNEDMNDIIKIIESLEKSSLLIDGANETVKHLIKKQQDWFLGATMASMVASLIVPTASSLI